MNTIDDIYKFLTDLAPLNLQENYDNAGFLFGNLKSDVSKVLLCLDVTSDIIKEANDKGYDLLISHHPLIFGGCTKVVTNDPTGIKLLALAKSDLNVISMHTNLDKVLVNKVLIKYLADENYCQPLDYMCIGELNCEMNLEDYITKVKNSLNAPGVRYYNAGRKVNRVACIGGAGDEGLIDAVNLGADTFITADIRYHVYLSAMELGINLIDANHFSTENVVLSELAKMLSEKFKNIKFDLAENNVMVLEYA